MNAILARHNRAAARIAQEALADPATAEMLAELRGEEKGQVLVMEQKRRESREGWAVRKIAGPHPPAPSPSEAGEGAGG